VLEGLHISPNTICYLKRYIVGQFYQSKKPKDYDNLQAFVFIGDAFMNQHGTSKNAWREL
jgi:hypothetical protein